MLCGIRVRWLLLGLLCCMPAAYAIEPVAVTALPVEARETLQLIRRGGPFPYPRDGIVFGNYEHHLPPQPRGYYHEYTVRTPRVYTRGARRIVCGPLPECYYTGDHYRTFRRIAGVR
jgi:ribonuclease T1